MNWLAVFFGILLVALTASSGYFFRPGAWYLSILKPDWTPAPMAFRVVWPLLYLLMAVSFSLTTRKFYWSNFTLFVLQLALNGSWSYVFFELHKISWGGLVMICLWVAIVANIIAFSRSSRLSAALLLPYILWVSFALILNAQIWVLNL